MRLGLFMMPLHPLHRDPAVTLQEDRETIVLADRLGYHDAFVGEHLTDQAENVTNSFIFLATLIGHAARQCGDRRIGGHTNPPRRALKPIGHGITRQQEPNHRKPGRIPFLNNCVCPFFSRVRAL
jgi:hypothetical protein